MFARNGLRCAWLGGRIVKVVLQAEATGRSHDCPVYSCRLWTIL